MVAEDLGRVLSFLQQFKLPNFISPAFFSISMIRSLSDQLGAQFSAESSVKEQIIDLAGLKCAIHTPENAAPGAAILYLHGGGYSWGSISSYRHVTTFIAKKSGVTVYLPEYRLAPEHTYPAAVEDSVKAIEAIYHAGIEPKNLIIMGDSAGGGLAVATMLSLKNKERPQPNAAVLMSPWADLTCSGSSYQYNAATDPVMSQPLVNYFAGNYAPGGHRQDPLVSPVLADLSDLPPMLIQAGKAEVLLEDARALADKAKADNVEVILEEWPDMFHIWQYFHPMLKDGERALDRIAEYVQYQLSQAR